MRNKLLQKILDETPEHTKIFVRKYADLVLRVNEIIQSKDLSTFKEDSEVFKWVNGDYDIDLRSIAKLESELEEDILIVTKSQNETQDISRRDDNTKRMGV